MKFNITQDDATFIYQDGNEKDKRKKVICIINHTSGLFHDFVERNLPLSCAPDTYNIFSDSRIWHETYMPDKFVGVAICSENDEYNPEIGRMIAFSRAKDNLHKSFFKRATTYINTIDSLLEESLNIINAYGEKLSVNSAKRHNYIKSLIGEDNENENGTKTDPTV